MNLKSYFRCSLIVALFLFSFYPAVSYAKEDSETIIPYPVGGGEAVATYPTEGNEAVVSSSEDDKLKDCENNFDISKVDFHNADNAEEGNSLLNSYLLCKAVRTHNSNWCDKLPDSSECSHVFNMYWSYYGNLVMQRQITPQVIDACNSGSGGKGMNRSLCDSLSRAILAGDVSLCPKSDNGARSNYCEALVTQNSSLCHDNECKGNVFYLQALKARDAKLCDMIYSVDLQGVCRGALSADDRVCEQDIKFKEFVHKYCKRQIK